MSTIKCPKAIKKLTGAIIYQIADTVTDKQTYFTVKYGKTDKFESASCTVNQMGVLSELIVDGETLISK
jgi:aminoglycoside N3'-acetyltransferase